MHEMVFTSAPRTFEAAGLGVVAKTEGIPRELERLMRRLNRFDFFDLAVEQDVGSRFTIGSHCVANVDGVRWHLVTRTVTREDLDYTGRKSYLVHHVAVNENLLGETHTAFDLLAVEKNFLKEWDSEPTILPPRQLKVRRRARSGNWDETVPGKAGLRQWLAWSQERSGPAFLVGESPEQISQLFEAAIEQVAAEARSSVTFITALGGEIRGLSFDWIGLIRGTKLANDICSTSTARVLDVNKPHHFEATAHDPPKTGRAIGGAAFTDTSTGDFFEDFVDSELNPVAKVSSVPRKSSTRQTSRKKAEEFATQPSGVAVGDIPPPPPDSGKRGLPRVMFTTMALVLLVLAAGFSTWQWNGSQTDLKQLQAQYDDLEASSESENSKLAGELRNATTSLAEQKESQEEQQNENALKTGKLQAELEATRVVVEIDEDRPEALEPLDAAVEAVFKAKKKKIGHLRDANEQLYETVVDYREAGAAEYAICIDLADVERRFGDGTSDVIMQYRFETYRCNRIEMVSPPRYGAAHDAEAEKYNFEIPQGRVQFDENRASVILNPEKIKNLGSQRLTPVKFLLDDDRDLYIVFLPHLDPLAVRTGEHNREAENSWTSERLKAISSLEGTGSLQINLESISTPGGIIQLEKEKIDLNMPRTSESSSVFDLPDLFGLKSRSPKMQVSRNEDFPPGLFLEPSGNRGSDIDPSDSNGERTNPGNGSRGDRNPTLNGVSVAGRISFRELPGILPIPVCIFGESAIRILKLEEENDGSSQPHDDVQPGRQD